VAISNIGGAIFDLGYTLIDYKESGWPEIRKEALHSGYSRLKSNNNNLLDYDKFISMYLTKKEEYRSQAFDAMFGWNIVDVVKELLDELKIEDSSSQSRVFVEEIYTIERKQMIVDKSIVDTLKTLKQRNYKIGIISNTIYPAYVHDEDLNRYGWKEYFDFQIYSSGCKFRKPHPSIFETAVNKIGLPAEKLVYVGDRYQMDALGAKNAGLVPVIKHCKKRTYPNPLPNNIPKIHNISELLDLL